MRPPLTLFSGLSQSLVATWRSSRSSKLVLGCVTPALLLCACCVASSFVSNLTPPDPARATALAALTADPSTLRTVFAAKAFATDTAFAITAASAVPTQPPTAESPLAIPTSYFTLPPAEPSPAPSSPVHSSAGLPISQGLGPRTKTSGCVSVNALPDPDCSPGAIFPDATAAKICVSGYSSSVRDVPTSEKDQVYAEYGVRSHSPGQYEVDHIISLEIGGSNDIANLFPEAAEPRPGFHEKDQVENWLHDQVCSGAMPLSDAQIGIAQNWLQFFGQAHNSQGGSPATLAPLPPVTAPPGASGHRYVASSQAKAYYYCETDPAWHSLSQKNLVWSDNPNTFIAKGLKLHHPC